MTTASKIITKVIWDHTAGDFTNEERDYIVSQTSMEVARDVDENEPIAVEALQLQIKSGKIANIHAVGYMQEPGVLTVLIVNTETYEDAVGLCRSFSATLGPGRITRQQTWSRAENN